MTKIVVECADPNDMNEIDSIIREAVGKCNVTYFKQHEAMVEAGTSKSKSESARKIAKDTGESHDAARMRIQRGKKETEQGVQKDSKPQKKHDVTVQPLTDSGGAREGAGRKVRADLYCGVCNEEFKNSYPMWHCNVCFKHLEMNVSECVYCHQDVRPDDRVPHTLPMEKPAEEETDNTAVALSNWLPKDVNPGAMELAERAIAILKEIISLDDPKRDDAVALVEAWFIENL